MNIAVCLGNFNYLGSECYEYQLGEILFTLGLKKQDHRFYIISDKQFLEKFSFSANVEMIVAGIRGKDGLIKIYLQDLKISKILKNIKPEVLISVDRLSAVSLKIPQLLFITEGGKVRISSLKKAKLVAVISKNQKNDLVNRYQINERKIFPVFAFANNMFRPSSKTIKEQIKEKYCEGKEYFLFLGKEIKSEAFTDLLKSFSLFKKRQQSGMKLIILASPDERSRKTLLSYKHRRDVVIIEKISMSENAAITGSSYAVIISRYNTQPVLATLNTLQCKVPVIMDNLSAIQELVGDAVLYAENEAGKELGDKMIRIYTDENLRDQLISKGENVFKILSANHTADHLWDCIEKALK